MATLRKYYPLLPAVKKGDKRKRSTKSDGWLLRWKDHKNKWQTMTFRGDKRNAEKALSRIVGAVDEIKAGVKAPPERSMKLEKALSLYLHHIEATNHSPATVKRYGKSYRAFQSHFPRTVQLQQIKRRDMERFRAERLEDCTVNGVAIDLRHLKAFFNWCYGMEYIQRSPLVGIRIETEDKAVRMLTNDEISALYEVMEGDKDATDLVTFYLCSGARATEILPPRFTWANVHQNEITIIGKGNKIRHVALNDKMKDIPESRKHLDHPFPFNYDAVDKLIVRKYFPLARIMGASLHNLRKTSGGLLIQAGVDIYRVSKFLGHSSVTVTEKHYVDLLRQDYADLAKILGDRLESDTHMIRTNQPISTYSSGLVDSETQDLSGIDTPLETEFHDEDKAVPGTRLELVRPMRSGDFKVSGCPSRNKSPYPARIRNPYFSSTILTDLEYPGATILAM